MSSHFHHDSLHRHIQRNAEAATETVAEAVATVISSTTSASASATSVDNSEYTTGLNGVNTKTDILFQDITWWSLGILAALILILRIIEMSKSHLRHMTAMSSDKTQQNYWAKNRTNWWPWIKKHILYAPLGSKRHNREFRLSKALNVGTLPSRFHTLMLGAYVGSNLVYCSFLGYSIHDKYQVIAELRGRSGVLAVINMIALILLAGRNNPLISWLKVSFDTYNLLHRWMGRIVILESIVHTVAWLINELATEGTAGIKTKMGNDPFIQYGFVGTFAMVFLLFSTPSIVRHAFYETFLTAHIIFAIVAIIGIYVHCDVAGLTQLPYIQGIIGIWAGDRLWRFYTLVSCNWSRKGRTTATIETMPGDASRVTLHLPRHIEVKPGSHAYLRFGPVTPWESHPFSVAWVEHMNIDSLPSFTSEEKYNAQHKAAGPTTKTSISFIIHAQTGMTRKLHNYALAATATGSRPVTMSAAFEGPYGGHHSLDSYGHVVLFAGSSGITHQIPFLKHLIEGYNDKTVATRRITLVWIVRDMEHLEWVRPWMDVILQLPNRREILHIKLFITRPKSAREVHSPSTTVQMFPGRPNVMTILAKEVEDQIGAMCVTVCGPGGLADNVREAVRSVQTISTVDFIEESFTW